MAGAGSIQITTPKVFWSTSKVDHLITLFKAHPCLYDRTLRQYNDKGLRLQALKTIASELKISGDDVYRKIVNLRSQFRREKHREAKLICEGRAEEAPFQIKWVHYQELKFLDKFVTLRVNPADFTQYSPGQNGFGDFDESIEEDVEYDGIDTDEFKVGEPSGDNPGDLHLHVGTNSDLCNEQGDNNASFQSQFRETGAKRHRPNTNASMHSELNRLQHFEFTRPHVIESREGTQERQNNDFQGFNSSVNSGLAQSPQSQSGLLHGGSPHPQQGPSSSFGDGAAKSDNDDEDMIFARYIASELRQLNDANLKRLVKHKIQNLVFEAHCNPQTLSSSHMS